MSEQPRRILGEEKTLLALSRAEEHRDIALEMAQQGRQSLCIFTWDLDPFQYDNQPFYRAAFDLARRSARSEVRILVQDSTRAVKDGHRLVDLAQRFSSKVAIHKPPQEYAQRIDAFMVIDGTGYLRRPQADRYEGAACFNDPPTARELMKFFNEVWERSHVDPQLRRLHL